MKYKHCSYWDNINSSFYIMTFVPINEETKNIPIVCDKEAYSYLKEKYCQEEDIYEQ